MTTTIDRITDIEELNERFAAASPQEALAWTLGRFGRRAALAWGGGESAALIDMMWRIDPAATRVFTIDTGRLPQETYDVIDRVRGKYGVEVEVVFPDAEAVERMVRERGANLFYRSVENRKLCCRVRKVEPLERKLAELDAWISGLRRSEGGRSDVRKFEIDRGILKLNPLADWTLEQVMGYIRENDVPKNALFDGGYLSIGCAPCTRAVRPGEDERAGRWWWETGEVRECGLHRVIYSAK